MKNQNDQIGQLSARMPKETIAEIKRIIKANKADKNQPNSVQAATIDYWKKYLKKHGITINNNGEIIK